MCTLGVPAVVVKPGFDRGFVPWCPSFFGNPHLTAQKFFGLQVSKEVSHDTVSMETAIAEVHSRLRGVPVFRAVYLFRSTRKRFGRVRRFA